MSTLYTACTTIYTLDFTYSYQSGTSNEYHACTHQNTMVLSHLGSSKELFTEHVTMLITILL